MRKRCEKESRINLNELSSNEYPYNLLLAVRGKTRIVLPDALTTDIEAGIYYAVVTLPEESQMFIKLRYCQNKTVEEAADAMLLSLEQLKAVEDKTLRTLRLPYRLGFIQHGIDGNMRRKMGIRATTAVFGLAAWPKAVR